MKPIYNTILTVFLGVCFGAILIESQAISWYRIQEMFYFQSFHMFGLLGSAIATGALSLFLIKKFKVKTIHNNLIVIKEKEVKVKANLFGGIIFGLGWGLGGACTAPLYILVGLSWQLGLIILLGALLGTFTYALVKDKLPH